MSSTENTDPKVEQTKAPEAESKPLASSSVFSMFGGGAKKEKKEDEDRGDVSGSAKAQREAAAAAKGDDDDQPPESEDVEFTPVVRLTEEVNTVTHEDEDELCSVKGKLFRYFPDIPEWKERGQGELRFFKHKTNGKTRLVMRQDQTRKTRANHYITPVMKLDPHTTSAKAWMWNTGADYSDNVAEPMTFCARFRTEEQAQTFKDAWLKAFEDNKKYFHNDGSEKEVVEEKKEEEEPAKADESKADVEKK
ncbi:hypothetical protein F5Y17DRAFT_431584 [Xylariaceae sp. FL0594]|nr:hypothetical protein F5Y17DRAFT_431584 [Xylariaceae sp. FL0594]